MICSVHLNSRLKRYLTSERWQGIPQWSSGHDPELPRHRQTPAQGTKIPLATQYTPPAKEAIDKMNGHDCVPVKFIQKKTNSDSKNRSNDT